MTCDTRHKPHGSEYDSESGGKAVNAPAEPTGSGVFITFEGGEGSGKSTHIALLAQLIEKTGCEVVCLRDPGSTSVGERLRRVVLDAKNVEMSDLCELFIYEAARAQLVSEVIRPALERNAVVLCDRFSDSTVAYQGCARGISIEVVHQLNELACQGITIDRTIVMSASNVADGLKRAAGQAGILDRLEAAGSEFHERVADAFVDMAHLDPHRMRTVTSRGSVEQTFSQVVDAISDLFPDVAELFEHDTAHSEKGER